MNNLPSLPDYATGFKTLVMGPPGSGKTSSIPTLLLQGFEVFVLFTEAGQSNLLKACKLHKVPDDVVKEKLHFAYVKPGANSFKTLVSRGQAILVAEEFGKMSGGKRSEYSQLVEIFKLCANFKDQNSVEYGPIDDWKANRVVVLDGLSGVSNMAMKMTIGNKPCPALQDYLVAMTQVDDFIRQLANLQACFVMIAHLTLEKDEVTGKIRIVPNTVGAKLAPTLGQHFNDVIMTQYKNGKYEWSTEDNQADLKASYLPRRNSLPADFAPLVSGWLETMD